MDIAEKLKGIANTAKALEEQRDSTANQEIGLIFENFEYKYKVSKAAWKTGKNLVEFTDYLGSIKSPPPSPNQAQ